MNTQRTAPDVKDPHLPLPIAPQHIKAPFFPSTTDSTKKPAHHNRKRASTPQHISHPQAHQANQPTPIPTTSPPTMCHYDTVNFRCGCLKSEGWVYCRYAREHPNRLVERCRGDNANYARKDRQYALKCAKCAEKEEKDQEEWEKKNTWSGTQSFTGIGSGQAWGSGGSWSRG